MTGVLAAVALALVAALVVLVDVKPWRRPPVVDTFTVTISVNTTAELRRLRAALTVDQQIRSTALLAAATWLAGETWTHPERRELLTVASALAGWIRDGSPVDPQPHPRPVSPLTRQEATPT